MGKSVLGRAAELTDCFPVQQPSRLHCKESVTVEEKEWSTDNCLVGQHWRQHAQFPQDKGNNAADEAWICLLKCGEVHGHLGTNSVNPSFSVRRCYQETYHFLPFACLFKDELSEICRIECKHLSLFLPAKLSAWVYLSLNRACCFLDPPLMVGYWYQCVSSTFPSFTAVSGEVPTQSLLPQLLGLQMLWLEFLSGFHASKVWL